MKDLMINSEKAIVSILKHFISGDKIVDVSKIIDWDKFRRLAEINSISGIVGFVFEQTDSENIPQGVRQRFSEAFLSTITLSTMRDEAMKKLEKQLDRQGIDHLVFKGLTVKNVYPIPELRTFGDIDFAIRASERDRCHNLMMKLGFHIHDDWEPVYSYYNGYESYEIHTQLLDSNLNDKANYQDYFRDFWTHAIQIGDHSFILEPEFHLMFLLVHIAKHLYCSGAGIRMYMDIAFFIRTYRTTIDWVHFEKEVKLLNLSGFVNSVFSAVESWFEVESPIILSPVDESFMDEFLSFTLNGGVFGYNGKAAKLSQVRKNSYGQSVKRLDTLRKRAFPSVDTIKSRYTYLDGKPWLLPAAWVHRFFKKKGTIVEYVGESKRIIKANKKDVVELNDFYRKIGL